MLVRTDSQLAISHICGYTHSWTNFVHTKLIQAIIIHNLQKYHEFGKTICNSI